MKITNFNNALLYSNKNIEKLARKLVNESSNAALMEMFDDRCILADHTTGQIFEANYNFDGNVFTFENFNEVHLEHSNEPLKEAIKNYFDDSNISLAEAYETVSNDNYDVFEASLTEALASKNMNNIINYNDLIGINEEIGDLKKSEIFKLYESLISKSPVDNIKAFNWKKPTKVSLKDDDKEKVLNKSMKAKAKKLKSDPDFKKDLKEAASNALNGDISLLEDLVNENVSLVSLDTAELRESVGLVLIGDKHLMSNRNKIASLIENIISEDEELSAKKQAVENDNETEDTDAPETSEQDIEAIKKALETAKSKATDEKLIDKIDGIINSLNESISIGETYVGVVKEAISLLTI